MEARCLYSRTGEGLHRFVDPADNEVYLYTQFEVPDARRVFATFEQPDLKASFQLTVTAPSNWEVVSIQPTPAPTPAGGAGDTVTGDIGTGDIGTGDIGTGFAVPTSTWMFEPTPRISTYLMALVAGPYTAWRDQLTSSDGRVIPLGVFCRASLAQYLDPEYLFEVTKKGFAFYEREFEYPYPFAKYDQLFVPEYNAGAMENPGCVTFDESYVFRSKVTDARRERRVVTILHELAHMWFGDLVTMQWWNDLWLNESFAEFVSTLATAEATEWKDAWATFCAAEKSWAYHQDALPSTHPIVAPVNDLEDVFTNFDGITYAKGASVLKQLVVYVGRENFMRGLHNYFVRHAWGNATLNSLLTELEATSGRPLLVWARKWLTQAGTNTLTTDVRCDAEGRVIGFDIVQTAPADHPELRPQRVSVGLYDLRPDGAVARVGQVSVDVDGGRTAVSELGGAQRPGLILLNDDDLTFAKIRLDPQSRDFALEHLGQIADPVARALIWAAAWDWVSDGELPAQRYLAVAANHLSAETNSTTLAQVLADMSRAAHLFMAPGLRGPAVSDLATTLWNLAQLAPSGSDLQLQLVREFAAQASDPVQADDLRALLDGTRVLPGLAVDTDLRWELLRGLARNNALRDGEIDAMLATDNTANGHQAAARARAAVGTPEAKAAAFKSVVDSDEVSNSIIRATAAGFAQVHDPALLDDMLPRYLESLNQIWANRSYHMAEELISGLYPHRLASPELRDSVQAWLDANEAAPPSLRRLVIEELADTERALRGQVVSDAAAHRGE